MHHWFTTLNPFGFVNCVPEAPDVIDCRSVAGAGWAGWGTGNGRSDGSGLIGAAGWVPGIILLRLDLGFLTHFWRSQKKKLRKDNQESKPHHTCEVPPPRDKPSLTRRHDCYHNMEVVVSEQTNELEKRWTHYRDGLILKCDQCSQEHIKNEEW